MPSFQESQDLFLIQYLKSQNHHLGQSSEIQSFSLLNHLRDPLVVKFHHQ